jgi:hypothetical protein
VDLAAAVAAASRPAGPSTRVAVVRSTAAATLTVEVDGVDVTLPVLAGVYAVGDTVLVLREGPAGGYVLGRLGSPAVPPPPPPAPPAPVVPTAVERTAVVLPGWTGTYRNGSWRDTAQLYQGDYTGHGRNTGAAHYGDQLVALGADPAAPATATLTYRRTRGGVYAAQAPTFALLAERSRPAGAPTILAAALGTPVAVDAVATWTVPAAWVAQLLAGTAGGLGVHVDASSPYIVLTGQPMDARALALTVTYTS